MILAGRKPSAISIGASSFTFAVLAIVVLYAVSGTYPKYLPSPSNAIFAAIVFLTASLIRNRLARFAVYFWLVWFLIGAMSLWAQNQTLVGLNYNLSAAEPNWYYLFCTMFLVIGILINEFRVRKSPRTIRIPDAGFNLFVICGLAVFPVFYALDIFISTGGVPILSGRNIAASLYETSYGIFYPFGIFIVVLGCLLSLLTLRTDLPSARGNVNSLIFLLIFLLIPFAMFDGRRFFGVMIALALIFILTNRLLTVRRVVPIIATISTALLLYVVVNLVRAARSTAGLIDNIYGPLSAIGTEYRDFVWAYYNVNPRTLAVGGYDWAVSTAAPLVPGFLARLTGFDKAEASLRDSAHALSPHFNVDLAIRIGLPGELYLAYGLMGTALFLPFGFLVSFTADAVSRSRHLIFKSILLCFFVNLAFAPLGQATVISGLVLPLLYLAIATIFVERLLPVPFPKVRFRTG